MQQQFRVAGMAAMASCALARVARVAQWQAQAPICRRATPTI